MSELELHKALIKEIKDRANDKYYDTKLIANAVYWILEQMADSKDEPQTETEIAKAIVHKMIDDAVIAEDAYPDLRQKMHDAVDEYEPQTEDEILREQCRAFMGIVEQTERSE